MSILHGKELFPRSEDEPIWDDDNGPPPGDEDAEPEEEEVEVPVAKPNPLHALLAAARQRISDAAEEKALKRKVSKSGIEGDLTRLNELIERREWRLTCWVAITESSGCRNCGSCHTHFVGWFTESLHRTDPSARRLQSGRRGTGMTYKTEVRQLESTEHCGNCLNDWIKRQTALTIWSGKPWWQRVA
jgi:DNA-directed RNA polymerase subunit M/transcription elongation factor TFIIS